MECIFKPEISPFEMVMSSLFYGNALKEICHVHTLNVTSDSGWIFYIHISATQKEAGYILSIFY